MLIFPPPSACLCLSIWKSNGTVAAAEMGLGIHPSVAIKPAASSFFLSDAKALRHTCSSCLHEKCVHSNSTVSCLCCINPHGLLHIHATSHRHLCTSGYLKFFKPRQHSFYKSHRGVLCVPSSSLSSLLFLPPSAVVSAAACGANVRRPPSTAIISTFHLGSEQGARASRMRRRGEMESDWE